MIRRKIKEAARELSKEEREFLVSGERRLASSSPWAVRRSLPLPDRVESPQQPRTPSPRDGAALERAKRLRQENRTFFHFFLSKLIFWVARVPREENMEEVRRLNELILAAKCSTILDNQVDQTNFLRFIFNRRKMLLLKNCLN